MHFNNSYAALPEKFYQRIKPEKVKNPKLIRVNRELAKQLDITLPANEKLLAEIFAGNSIPLGADPIAMVYAGHQFGHFVPRLGDGRAILLGEIINARGQRYDLQLKGSGRTMFSRNGDGRSPLGPVIREYIISEAMNALGIPTTRSLAMVCSGEKVFREEELPGAVLARIASSHIRVGTFEYFASRGDNEAVKILADYTIDRHYPDLKGADNPYSALLETVCSAQAFLVARWMGIGFIHGVMNTDNTSISGETIDYGPCAFMDRYDPATVFSSIDHHGRYAYARQPAIAQWNMASFAGCLLPLLHENAQKAKQNGEIIIEGFRNTFKKDYFDTMCAKIGFMESTEASIDLLNRLLELMHISKTDFTMTFRELGKDANNHESFSSLFNERNQIAEWISDWKNVLIQQNIPMPEANRVMNGNNPAYIPRNHRVEEAISAAVDHEDYSITDRLLEALKNPYEEQKDFAAYLDPPEPSEMVYQTFCGT